ncbi:MAG: aldehyde dehydrogenase family protein, partial [Elusimicrobiales bacterium]|nr:aldehyde dehydrogenase family protein [Elusimicrobiales bacterium]
MNARPDVPVPSNEPITGYAPGSPEKKALKAALQELRSKEIEIPLFIGGQELRTKNLGDARCPHDHKHLLGRYHKAGAKEVKLAVAAAVRAQREWAAMPFHARAAIFLKAADILSGPRRFMVNAAAMLCQSKNPFQSEIDAVCELADFWRFNAYYAEKIFSQTPSISPRGTWNYMEYRPLEGFVFAATPFNFASIAGNLPSAPALLGNTVVWKPASSAVYSAWFVLDVLRQAGLPDGVINMVAGSGAEVGDPVLASEHLAGIHFTGSTAVFQHMWATVGNNIAKYRCYPRLVGETGGKDFIFAHPSADAAAVATAMTRGAFEYQGQKCSAASRAYVPKSLWKTVRPLVEEQVAGMKVGGVEDFRNFVNAVIDRNAYSTIKGYVDYAKTAKKKDAQGII